MKKLNIILIFIAMLLPLSSCLHNNGDIGPWFGQWKVTEVQINGERDPKYKGDGFFCFQSSTFKLVQSYPEDNSATSIFGNWEEKDGYISVLFHDREDSPWLRGYFHLDKKSMLTVVKRKGDKVLKYTAEDGNEYTYFLKKW